MAHDRSGQGVRVEFDPLGRCGASHGHGWSIGPRRRPLLEGHSTRRAWYYGQRRALPPLVFCIVIGVVIVVTARTLAGAIYGTVMTVWMGVSAWRLWREPVLTRDKAQKLQQRRERIGMHPLRSAA